MFVKPKPGLKIPDPALKDYLPAAGREVANSAYWYRRLQDKGVSLTTAVEIATAEAAASAATASATAAVTTTTTAAVATPAASTTSAAAATPATAAAATTDGSAKA